MNNADYRRQCGTHKPFRATPEQIREAWFAINTEKIKAKRAKKQHPARQGKWREFSLEDGD